MPQMSPLNWLYLYFLFIFMYMYMFLMVWYYFNYIVIKKDKINFNVVMYLNKW